MVAEHDDYGMAALLERGEPLFRQLDDSHLFLTGATGFFGRWLLHAIAAARAAFVIDIRVTTLSRDPQHFFAREPAFADANWLVVQQGDVRHLKLPVQHYSHLIHAATDTSAEAAARPLLRIESMVDGTRRVLEYAAHCGVRDGLFTSSGAVYGDVDAPGGVSESTLLACDCTRPQSDYAEAKRMGELLCAVATRDLKLSMRIARCFAFVGPYLPLNGHFAVGNFVADCLSNRDIRIRGDGSPQRSYLYAADLVLWLLTILLRGQPMRPYNVGSDQAVTIGELAERVRRLLAPDVHVQRMGMAGDGKIDRYLPSIIRARDELGLEVWTPLDQGLRHYAGWARAESEVFL